MSRTAVNSRKSQKYPFGFGISLHRAVYRFAVLILAIGLTACAASTANMVVQEQVCTNCDSDGRFEKAIQIGEVQGGKDASAFGAGMVTIGAEVPNDAFRGALEVSLRNNSLLAEGASQTRFILNTHLVELGQPGGGFTMTAYTAIRYVLRDKQTNEQIRDELVEARFTATFSDSPIGNQRSIKAVEGSVRENIKKFVASLLTEFSPRTSKLGNS